MKKAASAFKNSAKTKYVKSKYKNFKVWIMYCEANKQGTKIKNKN